tara:strand:+ start:368 stop:604 length:237 start_codon:yes stop_codon:yes gene_type:complete
MFIASSLKDCFPVVAGVICIAESEAFGNESNSLAVRAGYRLPARSAAAARDRLRPVPELGAGAGCCHNIDRDSPAKQA